jgi:hypothetical protein
MPVTSPSLRVLTNPDIRVAIPADFPPPIPHEYARFLLPTLDAELKKLGVDINTVKRFTIAYPHKHPEKFPGYHDRARVHAQNLVAEMSQINPGFEWILADAICDTVKLNRTNHQNAVYALTARQVFEVHAASQKTPLPFLDPDNKDTEYFVIVDDIIEQGATVVDMMGYIHHNGGRVLCVLSGSSFNPHFRQMKHAPDPIQPVLRGTFADAARNTARLPQMAEIFSKSARAQGADMSPQRCMEVFEEALNRHGNTVFALTDEQCRRIIHKIGSAWGPEYHFLDFIKKIDEAAVSVTPEKPKTQAKLAFSP